MELNIIDINCKLFYVIELLSYKLEISDLIINAPFSLSTNDNVKTFEKCFDLIKIIQHFFTINLKITVYHT